MTEAKKRNPNIKLYGLSWAFPQWVSCAPGTLANCTNDPYHYPEQTAT
jgi:galactosylceramidase